MKKLLLLTLLLLLLPGLLSAGKYRAKGWWYCGLGGASVGLPAFWQYYLTRVAFGYRSVIFELQAWNRRSFAITQTEYMFTVDDSINCYITTQTRYFESFLPCYIYILLHSSVTSKHNRFVGYIYGGINHWLSRTSMEVTYPDAIMNVVGPIYSIINSTSNKLIRSNFFDFGIVFDFSLLSLRSGIFYVYRVLIYA